MARTNRKTLSELGVSTEKHTKLVTRLRNQAANTKHSSRRAGLRRKARFAMAFIACNGDWRAAAKQAGVAPSTVSDDWLKNKEFKKELYDSWEEIYDQLQVALTEQAISRALDPKAKSDKALFEVLGAMNPQVWDPRVRAAREMAKNPTTKLFVHIDARDLQQVKNLDPAFVDITNLEHRNDKEALPAAPEHNGVSVCLPAPGAGVVPEPPEGSGSPEK